MIERCNTSPEMMAPLFAIYIYIYTHMIERCNTSPEMMAPLFAIYIYIHI